MAPSEIDDFVNSTGVKAPHKKHKKRAKTPEVSFEDHSDDSSPPWNASKDLPRDVSLLAEYLAPISEGTPSCDALIALENGHKSVFDLAPQLCLLSDKSSDMFPEGLGGAAGKALEDLIDRKPDWPPPLLDDLPKPKNAFMRLLPAALRDNPKGPISASLPQRPPRFLQTLLEALSCLLP